MVTKLIGWRIPAWCVPIAPAVVALCLLAGCVEEPIRSYRIAKEQPEEAAPQSTESRQMPPGHPPMGSQQGLPPDHPPVGQVTPGQALPPDHPPIGGSPGPQKEAAAPAPALAWDAPSTWTQKPAGGMRVASFDVPGAGDAKGDLSIIVLGGGAGGLLPNVNRWRGQIDAEPWTQEVMDRELQKIQCPAGTILFVDLRKQPPAKRILAGILEREGQSWFFKLVGDDAVLEGAKPAFLEFLKTVRGAKP